MNEPAERHHLPSHHPNCFGCGEDNPCGLKLKMWRDGERVRGEVVFGTSHEGAPGLAHGGAVAAAFDDALGFVLYIVEAPAVTARLEVDYRKPVMLNRSYELDGWVERRDGRKLFLRIEARDEGGELVAEGKGLFLQVPMEHFLQAMPDDVPDEIKKRMKQAGGTPPW